MAKDKDFKQSSAEILMDLLSDPRVKRAIRYVQDDKLKSEREKLKEEAARRFQNLKKRYRGRTPETAARERELNLRLAEIETEAAELRVRLSGLLEEEERIRDELKNL
ncbi:hypothetical protein E0L93_02755 [Rubrobacter taiwanensis]|uniref:Uncharacterized protein n=1 Tax=Rubrobacter taiwanensis TaxID=185139 RepID=A0A4V6NB48_9ACTN|nr:hypothetical protein [Rubrobacter taiwanensis]TCJ19892.1 hypothetical protein E0L93_02755 [Rubrobacter taiwanensis]